MAAATSVVSGTRRRARASPGAPSAAGHAPGDLDAALDERGHVEQRARLQVHALHARRGQQLRHVGQVVIRLAAKRPRAARPPSRRRSSAARTSRGAVRAGGSVGRGPARRRAGVLSRSARTVSNSSVRKRVRVQLLRPVPHPPPRASAWLRVRRRGHEDCLPYYYKMRRINGFVKVGGAGLGG